jgi:general secretion pathway protein J
MLNNRGLLEDKEDAFEFTRTGRFNPTGEARSALQRIAYGVEDGQLVRYSWNVLDRAQDSEPAKFVMLENIKRVELQFLDASGQWQKSWPLSNEADIQAGAEIFGVKAAPPPQNMPLAIEFTIEMEALGKVVRIIRVS